MPAFGAFKAYITVPLGTANIDLSRLTAVVDDIVSLIAFKTDSLCPVELATEGINFTAHPLVVEKVTFRTLHTAFLFPSLAAIVVGNGDQAGKGEPIRRGIERAEVSME